MIARSALLLVFVAAIGFAQTEADPPSRVARLSYISGSVAFRAGSVEEWSNATLNYPLTTADHLWTDAGALAEIHTGLAAIRLNGQTALSILNLDDRAIQLSLAQGTIQVHLRSLEPEETFEVATPNVAVTLLRPGDYRIDVDGDNSMTTVTVRGGDAAVTGGGLAFPVHARQTARIRGVETLSEDVGPAISIDEFEQWCEARDRREERSISAEYVPREMIGYQDLDDYGSWSQDADYGWVWMPQSVPEDWAPYRYGRWSWVEPWGWTWIDSAPWGFAPFHYGRWAHRRGVWIWIPGGKAPGVRPVYAPALVVFVGVPGSGRSCIWFPLAPGEIFRPGYRMSDAYFRRINLRHVPNSAFISQVNITNVRHVHHRIGAVSVASNEAFTGGRHVGRESSRVGADAIERAEWMEGAPRIAPRRESVLGIGVRHGPPSRFAERTVVAKTPPPTPPVIRVEGLSAGDAPARQKIRIAAPVSPPVRERPRRDETRAEQPRTEQPRPSSATSEDGSRNDRPRRSERPATEQQRTTERSRPPSVTRDDNPRPERPRRAEQPAPDSFRRAERPSPAVQPRSVERPRAVEQPRRSESPRTPAPSRSSQESQRTGGSAKGKN